MIEVGDTVIIDWYKCLKHFRNWSKQDIRNQVFAKVGQVNKKRVMVRTLLGNSEFRYFDEEHLTIWSKH